MAAHRGPVYSPNAMLDVSEFLSELLADLDDNGLGIGQIHAEYAWSQLELSLDAKDPLAAADDQLLARETIRAAARANGLRASFAALVTPEGVGNGWHYHVSIHKDGRNLLSGGDGPEGMTPEGESFVAGILRDLQGVAAVTAPSVPSLIRLRPGYFASAYAFWGPDNREASLRFVPGAEAIGAQNANIELKAADASGNPYLSLTAMLACGLGGIEDGLALPEPIVEDPGNWTPEEREAARRAALRAGHRRADRELRGCLPHPGGVRRSTRQRVHGRAALGCRLGSGQERRGDHRRSPLALLGRRGLPGVTRRSASRAATMPGFVAELPTPTRLFTVEQANAMLPDLLPVVACLREHALALRAEQAVLDELARRAEEMGGVQPTAREAEAAVHACEHLGALDDSIGELQATGVRVKDAERGLLDFPSERDGELIELCWLYGEHAVTHWHRIGEGYAQRRRV